MKKTLITLAIVFSIAASATVTTPPNASSTASTTKPYNQNQKAVAKADPVCAQAALGKRDASIAAALQKYTTDWIAVLNVRTTAQKAAFLKTGRDRVNANMAANKVKTLETAKVQRTLNQTKAIAWDLFRVEMKTCGMEVDSSLND